MNWNKETLEGCFFKITSDSQSREIYRWFESKGVNIEDVFGVAGFGYYSVLRGIVKWTENPGDHFKTELRFKEQTTDLIKVELYLTPKEELKVRTMLAMGRRAKELNGDWVADWNSEDQEKWGIELFDGEFSISSTVTWLTILSYSACETKNKAKILLSEFKEDLEKIFL